MTDTETLTDPTEASGGRRSRRGRGGGREGNARRGGPTIRQYPWQTVTNPDKPTEPVDAEAVGLSGLVTVCHGY